MLGQILIHFLFASAVVSSGAYFLSFGGNEHIRKVGRIFFYIIFGGMLIASAILMYNVITHNFQYTYIQSYSSRELPFHLLLSTFYAGQEGSFMLWTLLTVIMGMLLLPYIRRHKYESEVMGFYSLILVFLLLKLVVKGPFEYVWETFAADGVPKDFMPANGRGLNPLLQNIWITIHPPILFTGFAAMSVPFVFAMAALIKKDFQHWIKISLPWMLFSTAILGFGIMLGGWWAYETLGWGGFWGWDPVENSSLIPWLVGVTLVHTMLTQRKTGGLVKTNLVLAVTAFMMVLYSTFLTRSGVLGDTSVHSFAEPGGGLKILLAAFVIVFAIIGYGMILFRSKDIMIQTKDFKPSSREFGLALGAMVISFITVFVLYGTSWPLVAELIGQPKIAIDVSFYNKWELPLAILLLLVNAVSLAVRWRSTTAADFFRKLRLPMALAIGATVGAFFIRVHDPVFLMLTFAAFLSLFVNLELAIRIIRGNPKFAGAYVSHFGIALLFLGIVATSRYSRLEHVRLVQGEPQKALGYTLTYLERVQVQKEFKDREKYEYLVRVAKDGKETIIRPVLYWSDFNKRMQAFLEPGISYGVLKDIYISPKAVEMEGESPSVSIQKNQPVPFPIDSSYQLTLLAFDMSAMQANPDPGNMHVGTVVQIVHGTDTTVQTIRTTFVGGMDGDKKREPLHIAGTSYYVAFEKIIPNKQSLGLSQAEFAFADASKPTTQPKEVFTVEASIKPFISLVWTGVILMVIGFVVSIFRRRDELKRELRGAYKSEALPVGIPVQGVERSNA